MYSFGLRATLFLFDASSQICKTIGTDHTADRYINLSRIRREDPQKKKKMACFWDSGRDDNECFRLFVDRNTIPFKMFMRKIIRFHTGHKGNETVFEKSC